MRFICGILEEYGLQFINHAPFTGTNGFTAANQVDINRWRALYADLYGAQINANADDMASPATVNLRLAQYARDANVELPILHFDYHSIRADALSSGRIRSVRNRLYDVAGQNPYQLNTAFAVAASNGDLPSARASFVFRSNQFWTNTGRTVATLQADFGDGNGFVGMSWNVAHPVRYATAGVKDVKVRVGYTDGSTWQSHLVVVSPAPAALARYPTTPSVTGQITALKAYQGLTASATISVAYGGLRKPTPDAAVLDRPLIVVKGFDVSGIISDVPGGRTTYALFAAAIANDDNKFILSDGADLDGYDIIYVDFNNGTDYIQRNAYLLEEVIKWVNAAKQPLPGQTVKEPNVMVAMSMGGLIAQYALCDIEQDIRNQVPYVTPHQVRLLITHDSPHQGANIPLSVQMTKTIGGHWGPAHTRLLVLHDSPQRGANNPVGVQSLGRSTDVPIIGIPGLFAFSLADLTPKLTQTVRILNQPATQQLSIYNALDGRGSIHLSTFIDGPYHQMVDYAAPYPVVATSDGSQCG